MSLDNYDFDGFVINLYVDEQGDWLAHFQELPNISAFGDSPQEALEELKVTWEMVKEDYQEKQQQIPVSINKQKLLSQGATL
ncbi:type II toxin-antitoxin system HicB family antitoxin [Crocosphaera sp.]|uniref:type II toxin-antitoxin system HicB family antitoxin n=1 Tax=Crocosphaera sp. TaxID=2729996 RepID=UPI003F1FD587|nr:type II toxin-antitoxin system HicB family antitoxin [Crocosphaera sp.]